MVRTTTIPFSYLHWYNNCSLCEVLATHALGSVGMVTAHVPNATGANVLKNIPETALKLTANDVVKQLVAQDGAQSLTPAQRVVIGGLAGAAAQGTAQRCLMVLRWCLFVLTACAVCVPSTRTPPTAHHPTPLTLTHSRDLPPGGHPNTPGSQPQGHIPGHRRRSAQDSEAGGCAGPVPGDDTLHGAAHACTFHACSCNTHMRAASHTSVADWVLYAACMIECCKLLV